MKNRNGQFDLYYKGAKTKGNLYSLVCRDANHVIQNLGGWYRYIWYVPRFTSLAFRRF